MKASRRTTAIILIAGAWLSSSGGCSRDQLVAVSAGTPETKASTTEAAAGASAKATTSSDSSSSSGGTKATSTPTSGGANSGGTTQSGGSTLTAAGGESSLGRAGSASGGTRATSSTSGSSVACRMDQAACSADGDCCSENCTEGRCGLRRICHSVNEACGEPGECCSTICWNGTCAAPHGFCSVIGEKCGSHDECCSKTCVDAGNGFRTCQGLEGCRPLGELCGDNLGLDCCSLTCLRSDTGASYCSFNRDPRRTCLPPGEACRAEDICCGAPSRTLEVSTSAPSRGECTTSWSGVLRCSSNPSGCYDNSTYCMMAEDCCSKNCSLSAAGMGCRAGDGSACTQPGGSCRSSRDCCVGSACYQRDQDEGDSRSMNGSCKLTGLECRQLGQPCVNATCCGDAVCESGTGICVATR